MIALDDQPFNVVNNRGFRSVIAALEPRYKLPSDKYFDTTLIPELSKMTSAKLAYHQFHHRLMDDVTESLLSITAHWITDSWDRQSVVVAGCPIERSHTTQYLAGIVTSLLETFLFMMHPLTFILPYFVSRAYVTKNHFQGMHKIFVISVAYTSQTGEKTE